jgi:hypothetical protein
MREKEVCFLYQKLMTPCFSDLDARQVVKKMQKKKKENRDR